MFLRLSAIVVLTLAGGAVSAQQAPVRAENVLAVGKDTRLLVVSPHPDDAVLAAGGLIQHVRAARGAVRIVYLTDGDGYTEGVQVAERIASPTASNYRTYGRQRVFEARAALRLLGVGAGSLTFLGFPNGGLHRLMTNYWSDRQVAYRSPYTLRDRPPASELLRIGSEYRGEDLTVELATVIAAFKPTLLLVPRPDDQHVDHCAAWFFVVDALQNVTRANPGFHTDLVNYVVHYYSWPFDQVDAQRFEPPYGLDGGEAGWLSVPLSDVERQRKRTALHRYTSQMEVMRWFLDAFARTNELFSRPVRATVVLPVLRSPCDRFDKTSAAVQ